MCKSDSSEQGFEVWGNQKATVDVSDMTQVVLVLLPCYHLSAEGKRVCAGQ